MTRSPQPQDAIRIPTRFFTDHCERDLPAPDILHVTKSHYWVDPTSQHLDELLQDAEFYADSDGPDGGIGLKRSAVATAKAIRQYREDRKVEAEIAAPAPEPARREGTKQATMIGLLERPEGATLDEMVAATGWQKHTVRGAMAGALKKRLGLTIGKIKEDRGQVYRIA